MVCIYSYFFFIFLSSIVFKNTFNNFSPLKLSWQLLTSNWQLSCFSSRSFLYIRFLPCDSIIRQKRATCHTEPVVIMYTRQKFSTPALSRHLSWTHSGVKKIWIQIVVSYKIGCHSFEFLRIEVRGDFKIHGTKYFQNAVFHQKSMMFYASCTFGWPNIPSSTWNVDTDGYYWKRPKFSTPALSRHLSWTHNGVKEIEFTLLSVSLFFLRSSWQLNFAQKSSRLCQSNLMRIHKRLDPVVEWWFFVCKGKFSNFWIIEWFRDFLVLLYLALCSSLF